MSQHYFYNGTQIDTFDGSSGTIVSTIPHDSSSDVSLNAQDIPYGNGGAFMDFRFRAKPITISGTIKGTSQADFEQKLSGFKNLFSRPNGQLKITNYGTLEMRLATFEEGETWSGSPTYDFTNYKIGKRSMVVSGTTTPGVSNWAPTIDLSSFSVSDTIKVWGNVSDGSLLTSVKVRLETTPGTDYYEQTFTGLTSGWNEVSALLSSFTVTGSPSLSSITNIKLTATGNSGTPVNVGFNDLRIVTTAESRLYNVTLSGPVSLPRSYFNVLHCHFTVNLSCTDGVGRSDKTMTITYPNSTKTQCRVPRYLSGSGNQYVSAGVASHGSHPLSLSDHFTDDFSTYADATAAGNVYNLQGTWTLGAFEGYKSCLREASASGVVTATIKSKLVTDGDLIAQVAIGSGSAIGLFARAASEATPLSGAHVRGEQSGAYIGVYDSSFLSMSAGYTATNWVEMKLSLRGSVVELSYRDLASDTWTTLFKTSTSITSAGSWGIYGNASAIRCARLELIDASTAQNNTLTLVPSDGTNSHFVVNSEALVANGDQGAIPVSGSFPISSAGLNELSLTYPHSYIGARGFYRLADYMNYADQFAGASNLRLALIWPSGSSTYIRRRGTFVYLLRSNSTIDRGDVEVSLQPLSGGYPTGTPLTDVNGDDAKVTISQEDITSYLTSGGAGAQTFNASIVPIEIIWGADVAVSASTNYGLVFRSPTGATLAPHYIPTNTSATSALSCKSYNGSWSGTSRGGYAILAGNDPDASGTPWGVTMAYSPTYL